jgi:hypothetical protein
VKTKRSDDDPFFLDALCVAIELNVLRSDPKALARLVAALAHIAEDDSEPQRIPETTREPD